MKRMLITGFEPFDNESMNPSLLAVESLPQTVGGYELTKLSVPVVFGLAAERVAKVAKELKPEVILCIGQAGGRDAVTPELVAINLRHGSIPDNHGRQPRDEAIAEDGPCAYFSDLPVRRMAEAISDGGISARVSYSAGAFVCNDLLYSLLHRFRDSLTRVGFIHVPYCKEQGKEPSMSLSDIQRALILAIESIEG